MENSGPAANVEVIELGNATADTDGPFPWGCELDEYYPARFYLCES